MYRTWIWTMLFFVVFPVFRFAADSRPDFSLSISLVTRERSKDSHSDSYSVTITGRHVRYSWQHHGFPYEKNESRSWTMSPAVHAKLMDYIRKHGLARDLQEIRPANSIGLAVNVTWTLGQSGRISGIRLQGMYNDWSKRDSKPCNLDNISLYHRIEAVIASLRNRNEYF